MVRPSIDRLAAVLLAAGALLCAAATSASAQIAFAPCGDSNDFACGHLVVPLDPSGAEPGTVTLAMRRHRAPVGEAHSAIIALAGGPGQPALPFTEDFTELLGPIAATRDLIVFDERGIGLSEPLSCHAFERISAASAPGRALSECAGQLGPSRADYTTADTVADIEAIRQAGGYEKLVLYGTSYGTKVAEQYAQAYPQRVEALVLDSVVAPSGPEPYAIPTLHAVAGVLGELCAGGACAGTTSDPLGDIATLAARMGRGALTGRAIDGEGRAHEVSISSDELVELLLAGDFAPVLRAEFLTAIAAAAGG